MRTFLALCALTLLAGCFGGDDACSCDIIATDSKCVEFSAPANPLYATQLAASCSSVLSGLCDSLGGTYTMGEPCPDTDLLADCSTDNVNYVNTQYYYSTGGDPIDPAGTEPEDDCADNGTVTRY